MSYKLPKPPENTPRTNEEEYASDPDQYGQICGLVRANFARELEIELNEVKKGLRRAISMLEESTLNKPDTYRMSFAQKEKALKQYDDDCDTRREEIMFLEQLL